MTDWYDDEDWKKRHRPYLRIGSLVEKGIDNIDATLKALRDEELNDFIENKKPRMRGFVAALIDALEEEKRGNHEPIQVLKAKPAPTYRKYLTLYLKHKGINFDEQINLPDLSRLRNIHNIKNPELKEQRFNEIESAIKEHLANIDTASLSSEQLNLYQKVIEAYHTRDPRALSNLNNLVTTSTLVETAFDIERVVAGEGGYIYGEHYTKTVTFDSVVPIPTPTPTPAPDPAPTPAPDPVVDPDPVVEETLDGYTSDEWKQLIDGSKDGELLPVFLDVIAQSLRLEEGIEISALREVLGDKFPSDFDKLSKEEKETKIEELRNKLTPVELTKFNIRLSDDSLKLAEMLPPHQLVVMAQNIDETLEKNKDSSDEDIKATLPTLEAQRKLVIRAMWAKTDGITNGEIIVDSSNAADVYDGAMEMFEYLQEEVEEGDNSLTTAEKIVENAIETYDEDNHLVKTDSDGNLFSVAPKDEKYIEEAFDEAWKIVSTFDYDTQKAEKESGFKESYPYIDVLEFEGTDEEKKEKRDTFIETIKLEAARNASIRSLTEPDKKLKDILKEELEAVSSAHIETLVTTDALVQLPENTTEQQRKDAIKEAIDNFEDALLVGNKVKVSDKGVIAYQAAMVNSHISFLNRLAGKDHLANRSAPILNKLYAPLKKIDKTCIARFGKTYEITRTFGRMMACNMGSQALNQAVRVGCLAGSTALGIPGWGSIAYGCYYAYNASKRLYKSYKAEKASDPNFSAGKWFLHKAPEIALSLGGVAAVALGGKIAQHGYEAVVRFGMMGAGWLTSFGKGVYASRKEGNGWWKSLGKALGNATASTGTAFLSAWGVSLGFNAIGSELGWKTHVEKIDTRHPEHSDPSEIRSVEQDGTLKGTDMFGEHATRHVSADEYNPDDSNYTNDPVANLEDYKNMTPEELDAAGVVKGTVTNPQDYKDMTLEQLSDVGIAKEPVTDLDDCKNMDDAHLHESGIIRETVTNPDDYKDMNDAQLAEKGIVSQEISQTDAESLVSKTDADLAKDGIIRERIEAEDYNPEDHPNAVKVVDSVTISHSEATLENAQKIVEYWTSANPQVHADNMSAYNAEDSALARWNATHEYQLDANRIEMIIGDCGGQMVAHDADTLTEHVNGDMSNEHAHQVYGQHKVFGAGWLNEHGEEVGITAEDIKAIAACHNPDGSVDMEKMTPEVLEKIAKLDHDVVSKNNEVLDTKITRSDAHTDGFLHRNADIVADGSHEHSETQGKVFNTYANGVNEFVVDEKAHYEEFNKMEQYSKMEQYTKPEQHNFIPFTVTFDKMWTGGKAILNRIMGANGKRKEQVHEGGERTKYESSKPISLPTIERS